MQLLPFGPLAELNTVSLVAKLKIHISKIIDGHENILKSEASWTGCDNILFCKGNKTILVLVIINRKYVLAHIHKCIRLLRTVV